MESSEDSVVSILKNETILVKPDVDVDVDVVVELCRLCANTDNQLIPIFKGEGLEHNIPAKLEKHLPIIKVTESDKLPSQICYQCASTLLAWHNLYEGCSQADKRLREILTADEKYHDDTSVDYSDDFRDDYEDHEDPIRSDIENVRVEPSTSMSESETILLDLNTNEPNGAPSSKSINETETQDTDIDRYEPTTLFANSRVYTCAFCAKIFKSRGGIIYHVRRVHNNAVIKCDQSTPSALLDFGFRCNLCDRVYAKQSFVRRHITRTHKLKCDRVANDPLKPYITFEDGVRWLKCDQCHFTSMNRMKFREHYRKHTGERPFTCDQCGKQFRLRKYLNFHSRHVHEGLKRYECDICSRRFSDKRYMDAHRNTHTGDRPFVCELCGNTFKYSSSLFTHKQHHTAHNKVPSKHICHLCAKTFRYKHCLEVHIARHSGEYKYKCDLCDKEFPAKSYLKRHLVVHSNERPFSCSLCGALFKMRKYLARHVKSHLKMS